MIVKMAEGTFQGGGVAWLKGIQNVFIDFYIYIYIYIFFFGGGGCER